MRDKVRVMVLMGGDGPMRTPDDFAASARQAKAEGYTAVKMTPFPAGWQALPYPQLIRTNTDIVAAVA